jgi:hypothetical protein
VIAFHHLCEGNGIYYAHTGTDGIWAFSRDGDDWVVTDGASYPGDASVVTPEAWTAAGLPLTFDRSTVTEPPPPVETKPTPKVSQFKRTPDGSVPFVVVPCDLVVPCIRLRSIHGGSAVTYERVDVSTTNTGIEGTNDHTEVVVRTVKRTIEAVDEHNAMDALRSRTRARVKAMCADTIIGWLSPSDRRDALRAAIKTVKAEITQANAGSMFYRVSPGVVVASIETDADVAAATVTEALRDAMDGLKDAINNGDVEQMRAIAMGLKGFDALVSDEAADKVRDAIDEARRIAKFVVKETGKKGRQMEQVLMEINTEAIDAARFMLIQQESAVGVVEAMPEVDGRVVDVAVDAPEGEDDGDVGARVLDPAGGVDLDGEGGAGMAVAS